MGGFSRLKEDFGKWINTLDPSLAPQDKVISTDKLQQDVFRFLYLRCLFEIAGNLDTMALCSRVMVEQAENSHKAKKTDKA